ncbi:NAD-dependent epimerase/dehydratase family protein [Candidatus Woesearchaeota archaeon]|nr:NAD-dependent epimerase/dehydratase family protein [Candidatus Woesearchaeota archaeon]
MRIIITGGAGFVGSNLAMQLVLLGHDVVVLDSFLLGKKENLSPVLQKITLVEGSITDEQLVMQLTKGTDMIVNLAAASASPMFSIDNVREAVKANIDGFLIILRAAVKNGVKRVLYASTSSIYGNNTPPLTEGMGVVPPNMYAATKLSNEHMARLFSQEYGLETVGFRFLSVYGPNEESKGGYANLASQFLWAMMKGQQPVIYGDGTQTRDFTYVKDIVQGIVCGINYHDHQKKLAGEVFNLGSGSSHSLNEMVQLLNRLLQKNIPAKHIPNPMKNYIASQDSDISKAKRILGYMPAYTLEQGLREMIPMVKMDRIRAKQ